MNFLKTHTVTTPQLNIFLVYWTNSSVRIKGVLKVRVAPQIEDRHIVAELSAMQHLLEDKAVIGNNVVGNVGIQLICSLGAIRKLRRCQSDKTHLTPYANFLTTRFAGCPLTVDKDSRWFEGAAPESVEDLLVGGPRRETISVNGLGDVAVTQHVLARFAERCLVDQSPDKLAQTAWKKLKDLAADKSVREVSRHSLWAGAKHNQHGKQEGRYFLNTHRNLVLVVTDNPKEGKRLVTTYPATKNFQSISKAA